MKYISVIRTDSISTFTESKIINSEELHYFDSLKELSVELENILNNKKIEIKESCSKGYEEGYIKGLDKGLEELQNKFISHLSELLDDMKNNLAHTERTALELACEMTKKIAEDIPKNVIMASLAKTALLKLKEYPSYEIIVNESNYNILENYVSSLSDARQVSPNSLRLTSDRSLGDLDCHIRTNSGLTIANFSDQIDLLRIHILSHLDNQDVRN
ncbi:MAG: FliH/SctL family protein [Candidatus Thiodiazotropha sp.]